MWAILLICQCFSRASRRCSSYNLLLCSFNMVDLRLWDALPRRHSSWRVFTPQCACHFLWTGHINSFMFMINYDCYIIKRYVSHAWCWFWTINALVEAVVLWWLYSNLQGHSSSVDNCQTFSVFIIRLAKKPVLTAKLLYWHWLCIYFICGSQKSCHQTIGKKTFLKKIAYPLVIYTSAS